MTTTNYTTRLTYLFSTWNMFTSFPTDEKLKSYLVDGCPSAHFAAMLDCCIALDGAPPWFDSNEVLSQLFKL